MKHCSCLLALLSFFIALLFSCTRQEESRLVNLDPSREAVLRDSIGVLDSLVVFNKVRNYHKARSYAKEYLLLATELNDQGVLIEAYLSLGATFLNTDPDTSFYYNSVASMIADSLDIHNQVPNILYNLAICYQFAKDYQTSLTLFDSAKNLFRNLGQMNNLSNCYCAIGSIQMDLYDFLNAEMAFDTAYKIAKQYQLGKQTGVSLANVAQLEDDVDRAIDMQREALSYLQMENGNEEEIATTMLNLGACFANPDSALYYYGKSLEIGVQNELNVIRLGTLNNMAYSYLEKSELDKAENCLGKQAIPLAKQDNNHDWLSTLYDSYADVLVAKGNYQGAFTYERKSIEERVIFDAQRASEQVRLLSVLMNLKNKELMIQTKSRQLLVQQGKTRQFTLWLIISILIVVGLVILVVILYQHNRLRLQNQRIESARILLAREETEKQRLGRELHDLTGQIVMGITGEMEKMDFPNENQKEILHQRVRDIGVGVRGISHQLTRVNQKNMSFSDLVTDLCDNYRKSLGMKITLRIATPIPALSTEITTHLYRTVQELLNNAGKYARESLIRISIEQSGNQLELTYSDEGPGFNIESQRQEGIGLSSIFERINFLGGKAELNTGLGAGTFWDMSIPI